MVSAEIPSRCSCSSRQKVKTFTSEHARLRGTRRACKQKACFRESFRPLEAPFKLHSTPEQSECSTSGLGANEYVGEEVEYKDSLADIAFIALCRRAYGNLAGWQSDRSWRDGQETYKGMVEVSRALMRGKTAQQQQEAVIKGFPAVPGWFRKLFPYSKWGAEVNARITPTFFRWLVGPMETKEADIQGQLQQSAVHIKRCRYLAESGCAGMCVNLCKSPVQAFFTQELGMPLTMKPNFEDYSCEMVFGETPPPKEEDEAYQQKCLQACPVGNVSEAQCLKLQ